MVTFGSFNCRVVSFCMARVALRDIPMCFITCQNLCCVARVFSHLLFKASCIARGKHSTLETFSVIFAGKHDTSDVLCCVVFANPVVKAVRSGDKVQSPRHSWRFVTCDEN